METFKPYASKKPNNIHQTMSIKCKQQGNHPKTSDFPSKLLESFHLSQANKKFKQEKHLKLFAKNVQFVNLFSKQIVLVRILKWTEEDSRKVSGDLWKDNLENYLKVLWLLWILRDKINGAARNTQKFSGERHNIWTFIQTYLEIVLAWRRILKFHSCNIKSISLSTLTIFIVSISATSANSQAVHWKKTRSIPFLIHISTDSSIVFALAQLFFLCIFRIVVEAIPNRNLNMFFCLDGNCRRLSLQKSFSHCS